ncbi:MAG: type I 3-dehydroquinate dehydratase [Bacteroidales bacterium]
MICISIGKNGYDKTLKDLRRCEKLLKTHPDIVAEIRLDLCNLTLSETDKLFYSAKIPLIATAGRSNMKQLDVAVNAGAEYVCINLLNSQRYIQDLKARFTRSNVKLILLYMNYTSTPILAELKQLYLEAVDKGADIVKIVSYANNIQDVERLLYLYKYKRFDTIPEVPLISYALGELGKYSRFTSYALESSFTFCALNNRSLTSPGQYQYKEFVDLSKKLFLINSSVKIPTSRSMALRAIIVAAISKGTSVISNVSRCKDVDSAIEIAKQIGANVKFDGDSIVIRGRIFPNNYPSNKKKEDAISSIFPAKIIPDELTMHVGESGLLARIILPLLSMGKDKFNVTGGGVLLDKDLSGAKEILEELDGNCILSADNTLPAVVYGPLSPGNFSISGNSTSQLITGLLIALPLAKKNIVIEVKDITSIDYIFLTLRLLKMFGIKIYYKRRNKDILFTIPSKQRYLAANIDIEGDWSLAANFIVCAAIFGKLKLHCLKSSIKLNDYALLDIVKVSGAYVEDKGSYLLISMGHLSHFSIDVNAYSNLIPILVVLAMFSEGESVLGGIVKSRIYVYKTVGYIIEEFTKMGCDLRLQNDNLYISGMSYSHRIVEDRLLKGGNYYSHGDHRMAMALGIASLGSLEKFNINGIEAIDKSFPTFNDLLDKIKTGK